MARTRLQLRSRAVSSSWLDTGFGESNCPGVSARNIGGTPGDTGGTPRDGLRLTGWC
jgi:hypothetical protein